MAVPRLSLIPYNNTYEQRAQCTIIDTDWDIDWDPTQNRVSLYNADERIAFTVDCSETPVDPERITLRQVVQAMGYDIQYLDLELISYIDDDAFLANMYDIPIVDLPLLTFNLSQWPQPEGPAPDY